MAPRKIRQEWRKRKVLVYTMLQETGNIVSPCLPMQRDFGLFDYATRKVRFHFYFRNDYLLLTDFHHGRTMFYEYSRLNNEKFILKIIKELRSHGDFKLN